MSADDKRPDEKERATPDPLAHGSEDFRQLFQKGIRFTEELLDENERLRFRVAALEATNQKTAAAEPHEALTTVAALQRRVAELETERARLVASFHSVELSNLDFKSRYAEIEEEHANLANLYIASYQLHATLVFREIVQVVAEIAINLVGVQRFTLYLRDAKTSALVPVFVEGGSIRDREAIVVGQGVVGRAVAAHTVRVREPGDDDSVPMAIIPLRATDMTVGAIVIDALLVQKANFSRMDLELFHLLGVHAAFALLAGLLFEGSGAAGALQVLDIGKVRALLGQDATGDV
jgi:hypothetical protein